MAQVEFEEEKNAFTSRKIIGQPVTPSTARLLRKLGLVKDENQAKYVMVAIMLICFGVTAYEIITNFL
jgi:hypothetical protein